MELPPANRNQFHDGSKSRDASRGARERDVPASFGTFGVRVARQSGEGDIGGSRRLPLREKRERPREAGPKRGAGREGRLASRGRRAAGGRRPATEACGRGSSVDHFRHGSPSAAALPTLRRLVLIARDGGIARTTATQRTSASASRRHPCRLFLSTVFRYPLEIFPRLYV